MGTPAPIGTIHDGVTARVGLLLPSSNILTEREFARLAPDTVACHAARLKIAAGSAAQLDAMVAHVEEAADTLRDTGADLLVFASTSGSFLKGRDYDLSLGQRIQQATGITTVTTSGALDRGLTELGVTRLTMVTPYDDDLTARGVSFLTECGYHVRSARGLGQTTGLGLASYPPQEIVRIAEATFDPGSEAVLLLCTNFRGTEAIAELERRLSVPVVSSNQATIWAVLRALGLATHARGPGRLLARPGPASSAVPVG